MRLLSVELNRFRSRRAVALLLLLAAALTVLLASTALWDTRPVSAAEQARAQAQAERVADDPRLQNDLVGCRANPRSFLGPDIAADRCEEFLVPRVEDYLPRATLDLRQAQGRGTALAVIVTSLLVIAGATFAGSDWSTGSMSNQLLFVPRRSTVWLAKALAVLLGGLLVAGVLVVGFWLTLLLVADARGISTPGDVLTDVRWLAARSILLAAAGGLGGYALTMLMRSTVGTVAVLFAYVVGGEALIFALPVERAGSWSLSNNVLAWLRDGTRVFDDSLGCAPSVDVCQQSYILGLPHGALYLAGVLLLALLVSWLSFRSRDVR